MDLIGTFCLNCKEETSGFRSYRCPNCNKAVCPACAKRNFGLCPNCYFTLDMLS